MRKKCELRTTAFSGGTRYALNNIAGWLLSEYDGFGIANVNRLQQRGPFQDGDTDLGFRRDPRLITLVWISQGCTAGTLWDIRKKLEAIFRPRNNDPIVVHFGLPNGDLRAADVNLLGELDYMAADRMDGRTHRVVVTLKASDPRLYFPVQRTAVFRLAEQVTGWDIEETGETEPWASDTGWDVSNTAGILGSGWNIGLSELSAVQTVSYANNEINADVEYPVIRIVGPITNPVITNNTTGETLPFTAEGGLIIGVGDFVDIDTRYGFKTVIDQDGNSVDEFLESDNDLVTFHFSYNTELLSSGLRSTGDNVIVVSGTGITQATQIEFTWFDRFIGA